jgi:2-furoyl-CoA dehydrogenase large subunit
VGSRMLEGAAKMVLRQMFEQLGRQVGGAAGVRRVSLWLRLLRWLGIVQ